MPQSSNAPRLTLWNPSHLKSKRSKVEPPSPSPYRGDPGSNPNLGFELPISPQQTVIERLRRREGLLNAKQVIALLGVHITTLQLWTRRGEIPFLRVGHGVRFDPAELAQWLEKREIKAGSHKS
jgi:excisionase family DNA binding protein